MSHSVERIFLGWDAPALERAVERIVAHYAGAGEARLDRATVVLPGARAGRRLIELLLAEAERRELRLIPPRVTTVGVLPELLYEPPLPLAEPILARRVWAEALATLPGEHIRRLFPHPPEANDARGWTALGRLLERLHREVSGAGLRFREVAERCRDGLLHDDGARWLALAAAQERYLARLSELAVADREIARLEAAERGAIRTDQELWLVGVVELPAIARRMLGALSAPVRALVHAPAERADEFDPFGCVRPDAWLEAEIPLPDEHLHVADRPADQAARALDAIAMLEGRYAADEITIGVPADEVAPYIEQRFAAASLPVHYAAGIPLSRTAPYRLLDALASYLDGRRFEMLAALLRHPDLGRWLRRGDDGLPLHGVGGEDICLEAADRYFGESLPAHVAGPLAGSGGQRRALEEAIGRIEGAALLGRFEGERRLAAWAPEILALLVEVYGADPLDRSRPAERQIVDACERIRAVAAAFHRLPEAVDGPTSGPDALRLLLSELEYEQIPAEPERAAIELLGWLELHLDDAPALVITGVNEPHLPESVNADPFLPNALRARLGLVDNDLRYARDAYQLTAMLHSRPALTLIAGRRSAEGDPLRPSRLLFAAPGRAVAERVRRLFGGESGGGAAIASSTAAGSVSRFQLPPEPELRAPEPIGTLRVTDFRLLLQDPYRFALERIHHLEPLDDEARELDGLRFGTLAHDVLNRFGKSGEVHLTDAGAIARALDTLLDQEAARRYGKNALPAVRVQIEQLRARLHAFARWHAGWIAEGWRVVAVEVGPGREGVPFDVDGEEFRLSGRIDRIDFHPERGEWAIFDYKTADAGDPPEKTHRVGKKDEKVWVDLQLPLYLHLLAALRSADGAPLVPPGSETATHLGYILLPRDLEGAGAAFADWDEDELAQADEAARDVVRFLRENRFTFDPSITPHADDPFAYLLGAGQLVAAGEGDDEGGE